MKKLLCTLLIFIFNFSIFAQTESYTYEKYGIVNQYTNNTVLPVDGTLKFIKNKDNSYIIKMTDPQLEDTFVYELTVSLKGYDELNDKYIYIGNTIQEGIAKGKCIISTSNRLDIYLNNKGYENKGGYYDNDLHENLSLSIYLKNMKLSNEGHTLNIPDTQIKIYPIRNITKSEKETKELAEKRNNELRQKEQEEIIKIMRVANIEEKLPIIKDNIIEYYKKAYIEEAFKIYKNGYFNMHSYPVSLKCKLTMCINNNNIDIIKEHVDYYGIKDSQTTKKILDTSMYEIFENTNSTSYKIGDYICKKNSNNVFIEDYIISENFKIKTGIMGVKVKNKKQKYYYNEHEKPFKPEDIYNWSFENIKNNGLYFIQYIIINDNFSTCKILKLDKEHTDNVKRHLRIGFLNK